MPRSQRELAEWLANYQKSSIDDDEEGYMEDAADLKVFVEAD